MENTPKRSRINLILSATLAIGALLSLNFAGCYPEEAIRPQEEISLALDQWIGWRSILMANGGLETKPGSINDRLGLRLTIKILDDNSAKIDTFAANKVDAIGSTINRYSFEMNRLTSANIYPKMFLITNTSDGGDGIIARADISEIEDLAGKRVAVPRFTEAHCLLEFCLLKSRLTESARESIRNNIIFTADAGEAGSIFFAGRADAAATWQPFLARAATTPGSHILIDTSKINNFILDGIIVRQETLQKRRRALGLFVRGVFEASETLRSQEVKNVSDFKYLRASFPMCANMADDDIRKMLTDAKLLSQKENQDILRPHGLAYDIYSQSALIWQKLGESASPDSARSAFTDALVK